MEIKTLKIMDEIRLSLGYLRQAKDKYDNWMGPGHYWLRIQMGDEYSIRLQEMVRACEKNVIVLVEKLFDLID